jgi:alginate O-acetyltransferase complex protein AlgI
MLFDSPVFLFVFLPLSFIVYFSVGRKYRNGALLAMSVVFYAWGEPRFVFVALASSLLDRALGGMIHLSQKQIRKRAILAAGVLANVGLLAYFKYTNGMVDGLNRILSAAHLNPVSLAPILLPVGLSFIVFGKITYLVDIYRGRASPARGVVPYLTYVFLFPKLLAGPIVKYHEMEGQMGERSPTLDGISLGICRFSLGLAKKVFVADTMGAVANFAFGLPAGELGMANAWLGALCFSLQIYFDFSAYSDMAIGLAAMMGFYIPENFNMPYISANFTEFWRRWHISLSTWIKEYLYIPLGGNRCSRTRMYFNLWTCFLLCGLWHGASWTFVLWGAYHGVFLIADKMFLSSAQRRLPRTVNVLITFILVTIGWVLFRAGTIEQAAWYIKAMFNPGVLHGRYIYLSNDIWFFLALGVFLIFFPLTGVYAKFSGFYMKVSADRRLEIVGAFVLLLLSIGRIATSGFNPFLYSRF